MKIFVLVTMLVNLAIILPMGLYPLLAWLRSVFVSKRVRKSAVNIQPASIIIAAHNEEKHIRRKLESFLDRDEWIEGSEIIVVSNGSTDSTNNILAEYRENEKVRVIIDPDSASKVKAVNRAVRESRFDLLVFSDCRQEMKKGSLKNLLMNFNDPEVGTVNSTLVDSGDGKKHSIRSLLNLVAHWESLSGSSLNVFGALYAQRRSVFREFPEDILFDDLYVVVSTIIQKKRLIAEKDAIIYDVPFPDYYKKDRISRLARGLLIFLFNYYKLIRQLPFQYFCRFLTFKYFKLILPLVIVLLSFDVIYLSWHYIPMNIILIFLIIIILSLNLKSIRKFIYHFFQINYFFFIAAVQFIFLNKRSNNWKKLDVGNL